MQESLLVLSSQLAQQSVLRDQVKSEVMQEVKDRPTFSEMIQFFFDKAKGMSTQPPFLSVHIEAVRRVTSVLETKFEETLTTIQKTATEQTERVLQAAALVDNAHEGMIYAVRKLTRKTQRQGRLLRGVVRMQMRRKRLSQVFSGWKGVSGGHKTAVIALQSLARTHETEVLKKALLTWKQRALLQVTKENSTAVMKLEVESTKHKEKIERLEAKVETLGDSKASTSALKQVQSIAEQRDYSAFLKDIFEYVSVQVKELTDDMCSSKDYIDEQCRRVLSIVKERLEVSNRGQNEEHVQSLERTMDSMRLQQTLLGEKVSKFDFLINVEEAEFKVAMLGQQLAKAEANIGRLLSSLTETQLPPALSPQPPSQRPSTVGSRPATRKPRPVSVRMQPNHSVSLVLSDDPRMSPTHPVRTRQFASTHSEVRTPPRTAGGTVESTPVSTRNKTLQSREATREEIKRRSGRIRSGKPFTDMKTQNRKVLDEMVIFNTKVFKQDL